MIPRIKIPLFDSQTERVNRALINGHLATGPDLVELENVLKQRTGRRHVILVSNGFSALFVSIKFASVLKGVAASIPISTCFAIPNALRANGYSWRFVDVDESTIGTPLFSTQSNDSLVIAPDHFGFLSPILKYPYSLDVPLIHDAAQSSSKPRTYAIQLLLHFRLPN